MMRVATWAGLLIVWFFAVALCTSGCVAPRTARFVGNADPSGKIPAIKVAAEAKDRSAIPELVKGLESDDPAVRFYSIEGLHRITGENFDYRYYDEIEVRKPAVEKWKKWLADRPGESNGAAAAPVAKE
jgi:hypothetical protein